MKINIYSINWFVCRWFFWGVVSYLSVLLLSSSCLLVSFVSLRWGSLWRRCCLMSCSSGGGSTKWECLWGSTRGWVLARGWVSSWGPTRDTCQWNSQNCPQASLVAFPWYNWVSPLFAGRSAHQSSRAPRCLCYLSVMEIGVSFEKFEALKRRAYLSHQ